MKSMTKKIGALILALAMCFSLTCVAFAEDGDDTSYTITVTASIGGKTYNAYKIFDATYDNNGHVSYTIDSDSPWYNTVVGASTGEQALFTLVKGSTTDEGVVTWYVTTTENASDEDIISLFEKAIVVDAEGTATVSGQAVNYAATGIGTGSTTEGLELDVTSSGAGYYFVSTSNGSVVSLTTAAPTAVINDKNTKPGEGGTDPDDPPEPDNPDNPGWQGGFTKDADDTSYSIGQTVNYKIRSYVPAYNGTSEIRDYTITDTMTAGLTLDGVEDNGDGTYTVTGVKVELAGSGIVDEENDDAPTYVDITNYCTITVSYDGSGNTVLSVSWNIDDLEDETVGIGLYPADAVVRITYSATVNDAADDKNLNNTVGMTWNEKDPNDPEDPEKDTPGNIDPKDDPQVDVYTYGFDLKKTDGEEKLDGAEFTLAKNGESISFLYDETTNTYEVWDGNDETKREETTETITVGNSYIWGLGAGTYTLTETKAPDGYNPLSSSVTIVIGNVTDGSGSVTGWNVTVDNGTPMTGTFDEDGVVVANIPTVTITNSAGTILPGTGGIGTTIFYIIGGVLVAGAVVVLITRRRMSSGNN